MPRFFFHLRDQHYLHEDCEGTDLPDVKAALDEALRADRKPAVESAGVYGLEFEITDSFGRTLLRVPVHERRRNPDLSPAPRAQEERRRSPPGSSPKPFLH